MTENPADRCILGATGYLYEGGVFTPADVPLVQEKALKIVLNDETLVTIACAGIHTEELAVGYLWSEGLIGSKTDVKKIAILEEGSTVRIDARKTLSTGGDGEITISSSGARGHMGSLPDTPPPATDHPCMTPDRIFELMDEMVRKARIHETTRGTHCAALADQGGIFVLREDIGRHNCLDMLGGYLLLNEMDGSDKILFRTGRVSLEIVKKVWTLGVKLVISLSVPTAAAVETARRLGITLAGALRDGRMTVYTHPQRINKLAKR